MALTKPLPPLWGLFLFLAGSLSIPPQQAVAADSLERSLTEQRGIQREAAQAQQRIDALDDESRRMLMEYRATQDELDNLNKYNRQMNRLLAAQEPETARLVEPSRQPPMRNLALAAQLEQAHDGIHPIAVDPSRGTLSGLMVRSPTLWEHIQQGGASAT